MIAGAIKYFLPNSISGITSDNKSRRVNPGKDCILYLAPDRRFSLIGLSETGDDLKAKARRSCLRVKEPLLAIERDTINRMMAFTGDCQWYYVVCLRRIYGHRRLGLTQKVRLLFRPSGRSGLVELPGGEVPPECQISRLADSVARYMRTAKAGMEPLSGFRLAKRALRVSHRTL